MKVEEKVVKTQTVTLSEKDIENVLRTYIVEKFGKGWTDVSYSLQQKSVAPYMGQIDDEYETVAYFKLTETT